MLESEWLNVSIKRIPLFFSFAGRFLAFYFYLFDFGTLFAFKQFALGRALYTFFNRKWYFDKVYNEWVAVPLLRFAYRHTYQNRDRGLLEFFGPQGIASELYARSNQITQLSFGFIFRRFFFTLFSFTLILLVLGY